MKLSIIVPVYNVEKYLERCLNTLLNQTINDYEIILVDDGSTDNCAQICDNYKKQYSNIIKVIHKKNAGLGLARNSGLEIAIGEYVAFIDSDDYVDNNMFKDLYEYAKENACDVVYCNYNIYKEDNNIKKIIENDEYILHKGKNEIKDVLLDMIGPTPFYHSDVKLLMSVWRGIYSRKIITNYHLQFVSERIYIAEDIMWHIDFLPHCNCVGMIPQAYYYYCDNGASLTRTYRKDRFDKERFLYQVQQNKLENLGFTQLEFQTRLDRQFLLKIRACITQEVRYIPQIGYKEAKNNIKEIITKPEVEKLFQTYPYKHLPLKHQIFFILAKLHLYTILIRLFSFYLNKK